MNLLHQITLPGPVNSIGVEPDGDRVAIAVDDRLLLVYRVSGGMPVQVAEWPIGPDRYLRPGDRSVKLRETRVAFPDSRAVLVARVLSRTTSDRSVPAQDLFRSVLIAIDPATGSIRGEYDHRGGHRMGSAPLPIAADLVLLDLVQTVACIDTISFEELCRVRELDERGDPVGDDVDPDETLALNGLAYQPSDGWIYALWQVFDKAVLECHRLDRAGRRFVRERRGAVMRGHEWSASGLCANPGGSGVTAWFPVHDELIDLSGVEDVRPPTTARLGRLLVIAEDGHRPIDIESEIASDFLSAPQYAAGPDGQMVTIGFRIGVEEPYTGLPIYIDDRTLLLNSPGGLLFRVNTLEGDHTIVHDGRSPITALQFQRTTGLVLAGCEDGTLSVFST